MARKTVTEEEMGLGPTEEELGTVDETQLEPDDDGAPEPDEDRGAPDEPADPVKAEDKPAEEAKMVDLRALQEARNEAREARQHAATLEQRWNEFLAAQTKPKAEEKPIPEWDSDPIGAGKWTQEELLAMRREQEERAQAETRQRTETQQRQAIMSTASAEFEQAQKLDPEIKPIYDALFTSFAREIEFFPGLTLEQRRQQIADTEFSHIAYAKQNNIPLADYIRGLAAARGVQITQTSPQPAPQKKTDMAAVAASQQRHQSLSDAPGGDAPAPLDAKALAKMSDKDFKAWISKRGNEQKFDEIMGG